MLIDYIYLISPSLFLLHKVFLAEKYVPLIKVLLVGQLMNLNCRYCNAPILSENINLNNTLAKCHKCNAVFNFSGYISNSSQNYSQNTFASQQQRPPVPLPDSVSIEKLGDTLLLKQRWFSWKLLFLVFFCIAWDSFLLFWYSQVFRSNAPIIFSVFPLIHVAVGIWLTYFTIAGFLNSSIIKVSRDSLSVEHRPLPWFGNKTISTNNISQLFCQEKISRSKNGTTRTYSLNLITRDGKKSSLLSSLDSPDVAIFIEQQIES